jgi:hypothetical protein
MSDEGKQGLSGETSMMFRLRNVILITLAKGESQFLH